MDAATLLTADQRYESGDVVPPKIRDHVTELERAGFVNRDGKGCHRNYAHPKVARPITKADALGRRRATVSPQALGTLADTVKESDRFAPNGAKQCWD